MVGWIGVKKSLPEHYTPVLVTNSNNEVEKVAYYLIFDDVSRCDCWQDCYGEYDPLCLEQVIAWMPLLDAPMKCEI